LATISSAVLTQVNGLEPAFHWRVKASIIAMSSLTEPKPPRRMAWRDKMPNQVSIWLSHDSEVGVKWRVIRGCRSRKARTAGVYVSAAAAPRDATLRLLHLPLFESRLVSDQMEESCGGSVPTKRRPTFPGFSTR